MTWLVEPEEPRRTSDLPRAIDFADLATIALVLLAADIYLAPVRIPAIGLMLRDWTRPLALAAVVAIARHYFVPAPSLLARIRDEWRRAHAAWPAVTTAVPLAIVIRLVVLAIGYLAVVTVGFQGDVPPNSAINPWWDLPQRWDAGWYVGIAHEGYDWTGNVADQQNLNFFPAYPMLVRAITSLIHTHGIPRAVVFGWTATFVSIAAFAGAAVYIYNIAADRFGEEVATGAVLLIATYPFAVFYSAVYSEALYLLCATGAWYHFGKRQPARLAFWGVVAGLCRPNGALLAVPLMVWAVVERRREWWAYLGALTPILGTLIYSAWAYSFTGHPLVWAELQRTAWLRTYEGLDRTVWEPITSLIALGPARYIQGWPWTVVNLAPTLFALGAIWPVGRRLGAAAATLVAVNTFAPLLNGGLVGMGRYTSVIFPIFIWLALVAKKSAMPVLSACFATGQGLAAALFFTWRQIF
jgi:hypothetical protein